MKITIADSDSVVKAGSHTLTLEVMNDDRAVKDTVSYLRIAESTIDALLTAAAPTRGAPGNLVVREGASGDYAVRAGLAEAGDTTGIIESE